MKATCYHLRSVSDGSKIVGGTLPKGMTLDQAADWLIKEAELKVSQSGQVQYIYGGSPVWVYLSVDPAETAKGKEALAQYRTEKRNREDAQAELNREAERELEDLVDELGIAAVIAKLREGK